MFVDMPLKRAVLHSSSRIVYRSVVASPCPRRIYALLLLLISLLLLLSHENELDVADLIDWIENPKIESENTQDTIKTRKSKKVEVKKTFSRMKERKKRKKKKKKKRKKKKKIYTYIEGQRKTNAKINTRYEINDTRYGGDTGRVEE